MTAYRPRWRADATGYIAPSAGQWASADTWTARNLVTGRSFTVSRLGLHRKYTQQETK